MDRFVTKLSKSEKESEGSIASGSSMSHFEMYREDDNQSDKSSSDESDHESIDGPIPKKKHLYKQKFTEKWFEIHPTMKEWLVKSEKQMMCLACNKELSGGITHIKRHGTSKLHIRHINAARRSKKITDVFVREKVKKLKRDVKIGETKLVMFTAEHNLPLRTLDHLTKLIVSVCPDSEIAKHLACGRKKGTQICIQSTGPYNFKQVVSDMQKTRFSLIIDETTDISTSKCLAVIARYFWGNKIKDNFFGLIEVSRSDAESLFNSVMNLLNENNIPLGNLVGFAADNCSVMMGDNKGVKARFKNQNPNIFILGCTCHSFHLAASAACCQLPDYIEKFARDVYNYFSQSSKRISEFRECQVFANIEPHKILKLSQTRWLSLQTVIDRLIEQWHALILHFTAAVTEKTSAFDTQAILNALNDKSFKLYFYFLSYILKIVNNLNLEFQSESPKLFLLHDRLSSMYKAILKNFIKPELLNNDQFKHNLNSIDICNPQNYKCLDNIYIGAQSDLLIKQTNLVPRDINKVRMDCLNFYVELCKQIKQRFNFDDPVLKLVANLNPKIVMSDNAPDSIAEFLLHFPNLIDSVEDLNDEWRLLTSFEEAEKFKNDSIDEFWGQVFSIKNSLDKPMFPHIQKLLCGLLSLPHSSAAAERIFSQLNLIKTKLRNRLDVKTCNALIFTKQLLGDSTCYDFDPPKGLLDCEENEAEDPNTLDCIEISF